MDTQDQFKRGVLFFGSASALMRVFDLVATLVVLATLTREEIGLAAVVWSVAVVVEAINGVGVGAALVQFPEVSRAELDSLFWFAVGVGVAMVGILVGASPFVAAFYEEPILAPMLMVTSIKMLLVSTALVPLQLLTRELRFGRVGSLQALATGFSAITKIVLALAGTGAWAIVIGEASRGLYLLVGVAAVSSFRPRLHFALAEVKRFVSFGARAAGASIIFNAYRNMDYLVVGKVLGTEALGLYRVAFEIAMAPTEAILQVVNRVAYPVLSRIALHRDQLVTAFFDVARFVIFLTGAVAVFLYFGAADLIRAITEDHWVAAAPAVQILCWGGMLRSLAAVFPQLFNAAGFPTLAVVDAVITFVVLTTTFILAAWLFGDSLGVLAVCYGWLVCYPALLLVLLNLARIQLPISVGAYLANLRGPAFGLLFAAGVTWLVSLVTPAFGSPALAAVALGAATALSIIGYSRVVLGVSPRDLLPRKAPPS